MCPRQETIHIKAITKCPQSTTINAFGLTYHIHITYTHVCDRIIHFVCTWRRKIHSILNVIISFSWMMCDNVIMSIFYMCAYVWVRVECFAIVSEITNWFELKVVHTVQHFVKCSFHFYFAYENVKWSKEWNEKEKKSEPSKRRNQ